MKASELAKILLQHPDRAVCVVQEYIYDNGETGWTEDVIENMNAIHLADENRILIGSNSYVSECKAELLFPKDGITRSRSGGD